MKLVEHEGLAQSHSDKYFNNTSKEGRFGSMKTVMVLSRNTMSYVFL